MSSNKKADKEFSKLKEKTVLPEWLQNELPPHEKRNVISYSDGLFRFSVSDQSFTNLIEAYDASRGNKGEYQTVLDESVNGHGGKLTGGMFFCDSEEGKNSSRLLISHTTEDTEDLLKFDYGIWLTKQNPKYLKNQNDAVEAYNWLQHHPIFWHRYTEEKTFDWETASGLKDLSTWVYRHKGKPNVSLEHGSHVPPNYKEFYHDPRLDVSARTFEKAYIKLAKKVNKFFAPDGTERPDVKYKKNKFEEQLDEVFSKAKPVSE